MKCFALWINDNGSSMVAELSPEQGEDLVQQVQTTPAASPEEAMDKLQEMIGSSGQEGSEASPDGDEMAAAMRGYGKGPGPAKSGGGMSMGKVFGDE